MWLNGHVREVAWVGRPGVVLMPSLEKTAGVTSALHDRLLGRCGAAACCKHGANGTEEIHSWQVKDASIQWVLLDTAQPISGK